MLAYCSKRGGRPTSAPGPAGGRVGGARGCGARIRLTLLGLCLLATLLGLAGSWPVARAEAPVRHYESTLTVDSYDWPAALVDDPAQPYFPYQRLNFDRVGPPAPRRLRTLVLENDRLVLTVVPELGGRLYSVRWRDSDQEVFYRNPVLKPTHWGFRGWWLATGGIEFAYPTEEHGLNEYVPWEATTAEGPDWAAIIVSDRERTTGTDVAVEIGLRAGEAAFTLSPRLANRTAAPADVQFWVNAMLALGAENRVDPNATRFAFPVDRMLVHSTDDSTLPPPHTGIDWPIWQGRDLSRLANWRGYLGLFGAESGPGVMGAFNERTGLGVVRHFPAETARGIKLFAFGPAPDTALYTDDGSSYFELWGGLTPTFWEAMSLQPGQTVGWHERWVPVRDQAAFQRELARP